MPQYILAKHAAPGYAESYYGDDHIAIKGLSKDCSCIGTHTAKAVEYAQDVIIKHVYEEREYTQATMHCQYLNEVNPSGGYAVCLLLPELSV